MKKRGLLLLIISGLAVLPGCYEELDGGAANQPPPRPQSTAGSESTADRLIDGTSQPALGKARDSAKSTIGAVEDRSRQLADQIDDGGFDD